MNVDGYEPGLQEYFDGDVSEIERRPKVVIDLCSDEDEYAEVNGEERVSDWTTIEPDTSYLQNTASLATSSTPYLLDRRNAPQQSLPPERPLKRRRTVYGDDYNAELGESQFNFDIQYDQDRLLLDDTYTTADQCDFGNHAIVDLTRDDAATHSLVDTCGLECPITINEHVELKEKGCEKRAEFRSKLGSRRKRPKQAPYYDDERYGVRMYRGPGFEQFPIPLGADPKHQAICDLWDRRQREKVKRWHRTQTIVDSHGTHVEQTTILDSEDDPVSDDEEDELVGVDALGCVESVIEVLPDADYDFVLDMVQSMSMKLTEGCRIVPAANDVVTKIMDLQDYPRALTTNSRDEVTGATIKMNREEIMAQNYQTDALVLLEAEYKLVPTHYILQIIMIKKSLYEAYLTLHTYESVAASDRNAVRPYKRLRNPRPKLEKKYVRRRPMVRDERQWRRLVTELQAAKQNVEKEKLDRERQAEKEAAETANLEQHIANKDVIECQCCFDDEIPTNRTIGCQNDDVHLYCFQCIERLAGTVVGSGQFRMLCMSQSGCKEPLDATKLPEAIPESVLRKLALNQLHAEVDAAQIDGLEKCPHCDFRGICVPIEQDPIFSCLDPECGRMTCRLCQLPAHNPKSCDQVRKEKGLSEKRHLIEEARSLAMMRTCPRCRKKVIKEHGCNKLYCTCGCASCFVCQKDITKEGYRHFQSNTGCPQHDSFDRHRLDADDAEKSAIEKIREEHPEYAAQDLAVDVSLQNNQSRPNQPTPALQQEQQEQQQQQQQQQNAPPNLPPPNRGPVMPPLADRPFGHGRHAHGAGFHQDEVNHLFGFDMFPGRRLNPPAVIPNAGLPTGPVGAAIAHPMPFLGLWPPHGFPAIPPANMTAGPADYNATALPMVNAMAQNVFDVDALDFDLIPDDMTTFPWH